MKYTDLLREKDFLDVNRRSKEMGGSEFTSIQWGNETVMFNTFGLTGLWIQKVQLQNVNYEYFAELKWEKQVDYVRKSDVKVFCDCPAFLYWGFKYIAAREGYGLEPEGRKPSIRNPDLKGKVCKHLFSVMSIWPFISNQIASQLREEVIQRAALQEWMTGNTSNLSIVEAFERNYLKRFNKITQKIK